MSDKEDTFGIPRHALYDFTESAIGLGELFAHLTDDHGMSTAVVMPLNYTAREQAHVRAHHRDRPRPHA